MAGYPVLASLFIIAVSNGVIYWHVRQTYLRTNSRSMSVHQRRIRATASQAFLYVGAFLFCYIWPIITRNIESRDFEVENEGSYFVLLLFWSVCLPLQGALNLLIYCRPGYLRAYEDFPLESRRWCFWRAVYGSRIKETKTRERIPVEATTSVAAGDKNDHSDKTRSLTAGASSDQPLVNENGEDENDEA